MIDARTLLAKIGQKVQTLDAATQRYKDALAESRARGIEWADAEALYKKIRYTAELEHGGPAHERRAAGEVASVKALEAWRRAEVLYDAAKESTWLAKHEVENARQVLSAVQTASSLIRAEGEFVRHQT